MEHTFPSNYGIDEIVSFNPMYQHRKKLGISNEKLTGRIVGVRFTESKIFYDIIDNHWGKFFEGVDSCNISDMGSVGPSQFS